MQATSTPYHRSAADETSTIRLLTGLVTTLLVVAVFMVTQGGGSSAEPTTTPDERVQIPGDHLHVDLEDS